MHNRRVGERRMKQRTRRTGEMSINLPLLPRVQALKLVLDEPFGRLEARTALVLGEVVGQGRVVDLGCEEVDFVEHEDKGGLLEPSRRGDRIEELKKVFARERESQRFGFLHLVRPCRGAKSETNHRSLVHAVDRIVLPQRLVVLVNSCHEAVVAVPTSSALKVSQPPEGMMR